ncbi:MAG: sarcosine oxidase subunit gamma, partial [Aestuariivirga sp.]
MPDRVSPLADIALQGRFGADKGLPGVELSVRHPASVVAIIARNGKSQALKGTLDRMTGCTILWAGAAQYYAVADGMGEAHLHSELKARLNLLASVSDQSHGRVILRVSGPKARNVLAKGTPVDLHDGEFPMGKSALTQMAHVGVHLTR